MNPMIKLFKKMRRKVVSYLFKNNRLGFISSLYLIENLLLRKIGYKVRIYDVISFEEFERNSHHLLIYDELTEKLPVYCSKYNDSNFEKLIYYPSERIYLSKINDAYIISEKPGFIVDNHYIFDLARNNDQQRMNLSFHELRNINCEKAIINAKENKAIITNGISLVGFAPTNYYHFTIEILSKLYLVDSKNLYLDYPLLIDERVKKIPSLVEMINILNIHGRDIIYINFNTKYLVKELIFPSAVNWLPINVYNYNSIESDFRLYDKPIMYLRDKILKNILVGFQKKN